MALATHGSDSRHETCHRAKSLSIHLDQQPNILTSSAGALGGYSKQPHSQPPRKIPHLSRKPPSRCHPLHLQRHVAKPLLRPVRLVRPTFKPHSQATFCHFSAMQPQLFAVPRKMISHTTCGLGEAFIFLLSVSGTWEWRKRRGRRGGGAFVGGEGNERRKTRWVISTVSCVSFFDSRF